MVSGGGKRIKDRAAAAAPSALPTSRLLVWHSRFDHARSRHAGLVRGHALNQQLEVMLPPRAATELAEALQWETSFYYELTAPLALLLSPRFITEYVVGGGALYMVAKNVAVDSQNTATLLPSGELLLLVDSETYEQLGLVGHKYAQQLPAEAQPARARLRSRRGQRYVVSIDLKSPAFAGGSDHVDQPAAQFRDRVLRCLSTKFDPLTMLVCAYNERGAPRTIIFGDDDTIERKRVEVNGALDTLSDIFVPALDQFVAESAGNTIEMPALRASLESVYDWLGVVSCRLPELLRQKPLEQYVSTFDGIPEGVTMEAHGELAVVRWRGLIASEFVERVLARTREVVASSKLPWAAVSVWGFADAVVSWQQEFEASRSRAQQKKRDKKSAETGEEADRHGKKDVANREHGYLLNGNNNYSVLVLPQHEYYLLQEVGPHDATM